MRQISLRVAPNIEANVHDKVAVALRWCCDQLGCSAHRRVSASTGDGGRVCPGLIVLVGSAQVMVGPSMPVVVVALVVVVVVVAVASVVGGVCVVG
mmetsp:Transcript_2563/g.4843  ORF Transcript_2563/g.4843 Transcript_2563/m.4843 type:complete len:96 (-) Transcript_2563:209-496(-)